MATMNISVPDEMKDWIEARVAEGHHAGTSDYVRDLVRRDQRRAEAEAWLRIEIQKGLDSGPAKPLDRDALLSEIKEKYRRQKARG